MKIRVYLDKVACLKAGKDIYGYAIVEVPAASLTTEQREELAKHASYNYDKTPAADFYLDGPVTMVGVVCHYLPPTLTEATPETVISRINNIITAREAALREKIELEAKEEAAREKELSQWKNQPLEERLQFRYEWTPSKNTHELLETPEWQEARQEADRRNAEAKRQRQQEDDEQKKRKEDGIRALLAWGTECGSELLHACILENFSWQALAEQEFAQATLKNLNIKMEGATTPNGFEFLKYVERNSPTLEEIKVFQSLKEEIVSKEAPVNVKLIWSSYGDGDNEVKRTEVRLTVTTPTGREITTDFLPESVKQHQ